MAVISADAPSRWLFSTVAALAAHGALLLGTPEAARPQLEAVEPVWMSLVSGAGEGANAGSSGGSAAPAQPAAPARRAPRPRASARPHVPAEPQASLPTPPADDASRDALAASSTPGDSEGGSNSGGGGAPGRGSRGEEGSGFGPDLGRGAGTVVSRPALIASRNPCDGYFPLGAQVDHGRVQIQVHVDEQGQVRVSEVVVEAPLGQDFGRAARACASALRFAPARDAAGVAVAGDAKLELTFHRS